MTRTVATAVLAALAGTAMGAGGPEARPTGLIHDGHAHDVTEGPGIIPGAPFRGCGKAHFARAMAQAGLNPGGESAYPLAIRAANDLSDTDLTHVDLDIEVFFGVNEIAGTSAMHLTSEVDNLTTFTFQLITNLQVNSVTVDGTPAGFSTSANGTRVVTLPSAKNTGESFVVEVDYEGETVSGFFGSIEWDTIRDNNFPTDQPSSQMVYTLSQPYYAYTWWPCKDTAVFGEGDYSDKFTLDFSITAPTNFSSTANGVLQSIDVPEPGKRRFNYSHSYEIPTYLVAFATSIFNTYQQTWNYSDGVNDYSMPLDVWFTQSNDQQSARDEWFKMGDMLTVFSDLWGVYPFHQERYGMYEFGFPGGMEHQTNTGQIGWFFEDWLTAHEAAHQWFGDWVTCKTWHDIWFQEGMATYAEVLWEEFQPGVFDPDFERIDLMSGEYFPFDLTSSAYVYDVSDPDRMFDYSHTYLRGGWIWHMIRGQVGDDAFFQALTDFASWYAQDAATTDEILAAVNASTGQDLSDIFADYVYGAGAPQIEYGWTTSESGGQDYLRLSVVQSQDPSYGDGGVFGVPFPVRLNGTDEIRVRSEHRTHYFTVPVPSEVSFLEFDPENWVLKDFSAEGLLTGMPPVIVDASADQAGASVVFLDAVSIDAADVSVVTADPAGLPQAFTFGYSTGSRTATLDFTDDLAPGDYLLTVRDTVASSGEGISLDGEGESFPTGDGAPGGDFVLRFTVGGGCPADINGDGVLDLGDINAYVALFLAADIAADINDDGVLDLGDINAFVALFLDACA
ncbi:MAG: M1 family aminopeptidase [Phycisphaerales bacterium JB040]